MMKIELFDGENWKEFFRCQADVDAGSNLSWYVHIFICLK